MAELSAYPHVSQVQIQTKGHTGSVTNQFAAELIFKVPWTLLWDFVYYCSGVPTAVGAGTAGHTPLLTIPIPLLYPYPTTGGARPVADSIQWEAMGPQGSCTCSTLPFSCGWDFALVTVHFATAQYALDGDNKFMSLQMKFAGNFVQVPVGSFRFQSDGTPLGDTGVFIPECEFVVTQYRQPWINYGLIEGLVGKVNLLTFRFGDAPPGTILYTGTDVTIEMAILSTPIYTIQHAFTYRKYPHNMFVHPKTGVFDLCANVAGDGPYDYADLNQVFS